MYLVCGGVVAKDDLQSCSLLSILFESGGTTLSVSMYTPG